jgi:hypothetical protein
LHVKDLLDRSLKLQQGDCQSTAQLNDRHTTLQLVAPPGRGNTVMAELARILESPTKPYGPVKIGPVCEDRSHAT